MSIQPYKCTFLLDVHLCPRAPRACVRTEVVVRWYLKVEKWEESQSLLIVLSALTSKNFLVHLESPSLKSSSANCIN